MDTGSALNKYSGLGKDELGVMLIKQSHIGDVSEIQLLLEAGAHVDATDDNGATALMYASMYRKTSAVKFLVEHNANVNAQNRHGWTPLINAAIVDAVAVIDLLIQNGADLSIRDNFSDSQRTALIYAKNHGHIDAAYCLLKAMTPEQIETEVNADPELKAIVNSYNEKIISRNRSKLVSLFGALISNGQKPQLIESELCQYFEIAYIQNIESEFKWLENTLNEYKSLTQADLNQKIIEQARQDCLLEVQLLTLAGAEKEAACIAAAERGFDLIVRFLLSNGVNVNAKNAFGESMLSVSIFNGKSLIQDLLIEHGADIHIRDNGWTALSLAVRMSNPMLAFRLLCAMSPEQIEAEDNFFPEKLISTINDFRKELKQNRNKLFSIFGEAYILDDEHTFLENLELKLIVSQLSQHFPKWYTYGLENELKLCFTVLNAMKEKRITELAALTQTSSPLIFSQSEDIEMITENRKRKRLEEEEGSRKKMCLEKEILETDMVEECSDDEEMDIELSNKTAVKKRCNRG